MARRSARLSAAPAAGVRSAAAPLAAVWLATIAYASLFPLEGWRWPVGLALPDLLRLPWPRYFIPFDISSNLLGYAPLGFLLALSRLRRGGGALAAVLLATAAGAAASYALELLQHWLPQRVPSLLDWVLNSAGALLGALLAWAAAGLGLIRRWQATRERWLERGQGGALALLLLWPVALLFPAPVPLGLGRWGPALTETLADWLDDVAWAQPAADWLTAAPAAAARLAPPAEALAVLLGMLAPCLLAFACSPRGGRRLAFVAGAGGLAAGGTTLSTALNFGPDHALAWATPAHLAALGAGLALAVALAWLGPRVAAALALVVLSGLVGLVHQAPGDPYFAQSLQDWEQGRFIRFHGLARWLGWLWPFAAMAWLLVRLGAGGERR